MVSTRQELDCRKVFPHRMNDNTTSVAESIKKGVRIRQNEMYIPHNTCWSIKGNQEILESEIGYACFIGIDVPQVPNMPHQVSWCAVILSKWIVMRTSRETAVL